MEDEAEEVLRRPGGPWGRAIEDAASALGAKIVAIYFGAAVFPSAAAAPVDFLVATDLALGVMAGRVEDGTPRLIADWTAWQDVRDPEVRTETAIRDDRPETLVRLTVQVPRIQAETFNERHRLGEFAAAVFRLSGKP